MRKTGEGERGRELERGGERGGGEREKQEKERKRGRGREREEREEYACMWID